MGSSKDVSDDLDKQIQNEISGLVQMVMTSRNLADYKTCYSPQLEDRIFTFNLSFSLNF